MNFSEFSEAYDKSEKKKSNRRKKKIRQDDNPGDKNIVGQTHPYNVLGPTGMNGDGPAVADDSGQINNETWQEMYQPTEKDKRRRAEQEARNKEQDDRMRYGKKGKAYAEKNALRVGEVKRWDKETKQWVSNKD